MGLGKMYQFTRNWAKDDPKFRALLQSKGISLENEIDRATKELMTMIFGEPEKIPSQTAKPESNNNPKK